MVESLRSISLKSVSEWRHNHSSLRWAIKRYLWNHHILVNSDQCHTISYATFEVISIQNCDDADCRYRKSANTSKRLIAVDVTAEMTSFYQNWVIGVCSFGLSI